MDEIVPVEEYRTEIRKLMRLSYNQVMKKYKKELF